MKGGITKLLVAVLFWLPVVCAAQENGDAETGIKWGISIGAFITDQDMKTEFGVNSGDAKFRVDFEDDLGLKDSQSVGRLTAFYKFNERHQLDFDIFDLSQSSTAILDKEFSWGDVTFPDRRGSGYRPGPRNLQDRLYLFSGAERARKIWTNRWFLRRRHRLESANSAR